VVEGWYGQPFAKPLARTREYVAIVRSILARDEPVTSPGPHYPLPLPPLHGSGLGKALRSTVHPRRADMPILLGAEGPKNVALAAEIADGWLPLWFSPKLDRFYRDALDEGFARPEARRAADSFEVVTTLMMVPGDDVEAAADLLRPMLALYIGGMGAREAIFHADVFVRMGYEDLCRDIQKLYLDGRKDEAIARVPLRLVDDVALVGPVARIRERLPLWQDTVTTTWLVPAHPDLMRLAAEVLA
jgi:F420-dependent oxidoreductase-like protein